MNPSLISPASWVWRSARGPIVFRRKFTPISRRVASRIYLSVEIGLQSAHDNTLALNNRGHTIADFRRCIAELSKRGIETVAHVMLGLPSETPAMMLETAREIADASGSGRKNTSNYDHTKHGAP
jgi:radical SAM superfamily enzyme